MRLHAGGDLVVSLRPAMLFESLTVVVIKATVTANLTRVNPRLSDPRRASEIPRLRFESPAKL